MFHPRFITCQHPSLQNMNTARRPVSSISDCHLPLMRHFVAQTSPPMHPFRARGIPSSPSLRSTISITVRASYMLTLAQLWLMKGTRPTCQGSSLTPVVNWQGCVPDRDGDPSAGLLPFLLSFFVFSCRHCHCGCWLWLCGRQ